MFFNFVDELRAAGIKASFKEHLMLLEALDNRPGLPRDIVMMNAGAALYASGVADSIADGIQRAGAAIDSGAARAKLDEYVAFTRGASSG